MLLVGRSGSQRRRRQRREHHHRRRLDPGDGGPADAPVVGQLDAAPDSSLPPLPELTNVLATQRDDSVGIDFDPVEGAVDYRVYPLPADADVTTNADGSLTIKNAVYRCAGLRQTNDLPTNLNSTNNGNGVQPNDPTLSFAGQYTWGATIQKSPTLGYDQIFGPLESVVEMNSSRLFLAEQLFHEHRSAYEGVFGPMPPLDDAARFPPLDASLCGCQPKVPSEPSPTCDGPFHGRPGDHAEFDGMAQADQDAVTRVAVNFGKALGAFERTLACRSAPFDAWVHGDDAAISASAQRGVALFVGKAGCVSCHDGPFLSDQRFHDVGLEPQIVQQSFLDGGDRGAATGLAAAMTDPLSSLGAFSDGTDGRLPVALTPALEGAFRTPTLRCVGRRPAFMHTGQLASLSDVVAFFDAGGDTSGYPGTSELRALGLTPGEESDLVAFLESLDGPAADAGSATQ